MAQKRDSGVPESFILHYLQILVFYKKHLFHIKQVNFAFRYFFVFVNKKYGRENVPICMVRDDENGNPLGGSFSGFLSIILDYYNSIDDVEDLLSTIALGIAHPAMCDDSFKIDVTVEVFIFDGKFIFGCDDSATSPLNDSIPLSDAKALFLEWKHFLTKRPYPWLPAFIAKYF